MLGWCWLNLMLVVMLVGCNWYDEDGDGGGVVFILVCWILLLMSG